MLVRPEQIGTASIAHVEPNHLLRAVDRNGALIWVVRSEDDNFAVFLTGEFAGRAFQILADSGGIGLIIGPVLVRVDPASISTDDGRWRLRAVDNGLSFSFQAEARGGFADTRRARVAETPTLPDHRLYLSRWSIGIEVDDVWLELVSFIDGEVRSALVV